MTPYWCCFGGTSATITRRFTAPVSALLKSRGEAVTTAPEPGLTETVDFSGEAEGGSSQFGYY